MEAIIFMFCLTLHNTEEALWLTEWQTRTMPNGRKSIKKEHFIFAVLGITILGYLSAGLFALFPDNRYLEYVFIGFVGAMLINVLVPHLLLTIKYRTYCPGVVTGCFLILPFHIIILFNALNKHLKTTEMILSIIIVGAILLAMIKAFEGLAKRFIGSIA